MCIGAPEWDGSTQIVSSFQICIDSKSGTIWPLHEKTLSHVLLSLFKVVPSGLAFVQTPNQSDSTILASQLNVKTYRTFLIMTFTCSFTCGTVCIHAG